MIVCMAHESTNLVNCISNLFITAKSSGRRNNLGFGFPSCGNGVTLPISTQPKPNRANPETHSPLLSKPAANPTGLDSTKEPIFVFYISKIKNYRAYMYDIKYQQ